jgi:hypothetical protein
MAENQPLSKLIVREMFHREQSPHHITKKLSAKLSLCLGSLKQHIIQVYEGLEVQLYAFLILSLMKVSGQLLSQGKSH